MSRLSTIEERRGLLENIQRELRLLETDLLLRQEGYRYSYVVDFAAIYSYVYKTFEPGSISRLHGETREKGFARAQVALKLIFSDERRPVLLIPPYALELRNHLDVVSTDLTLAWMDIKKAYVKKLSHLINESAEFREFIQLQEPSPKPVEEALRSAALDVGKKFFPELYTVVSCQATHSIQTLQELFRRKILRDAADELPEMDDFKYVAVKESADSWYQQIISLRGETRAYQSFMDALACTYLEISNRRMNPAGRVILFVSPSKHVKTAIEDKEPILTIAGHTMSIVRDLDYFLLASTHREKLDRVRETSHLSTELLRAYTESEGSGKAVASRRRQILIESASQWQRAENHLLLSDSELLSEFESISPEKTVQQSFLLLLQKMAEAAKTEGAQLEKQAEMLFSALRNDMIELDRLAPIRRITGLLVDLDVHRLKRGVRIRFPALPDELPFTMEFYDRALEPLARRLEELAIGHSKQLAVELRGEIMRLASTDDGNAERSLLAAYVLAMEAKLDAALAELNKQLVSRKESKRKELLYLAAVIHRKLGHPSEARQCILQALYEDMDEPRFHLECGRVYWLLSLSPTVHQGHNRDLGSLQRAIEHLRDAGRAKSKSLYGPEFGAQVENALAYVYCDRALLLRNPRSGEDLDRAEEHLSELKRILPEDQWIGRFYDTSAWILYARAILCQDKPGQEPKLMLDIARLRINKAIELSTAGDITDTLLQSHKEQIERARESLLRGPEASGN